MTKIEEKIIKSIESAKEIWGKNIAFPEARRLQDIFTSFKQEESGVNFPKVILKNSKMRLSSYCNCGNASYLVTFRSKVVQWIADNMTFLPTDYTIYPKVIIRDNGTALITVDYSEIIGGRWLAIIRANSINQF